MAEIRQMARFVQDLNWNDVPVHVQNAIKKVVLDTVGVGIGARNNEQIQSVMKTFLAISGDEKEASVWGQSKKTSLLNAVFLNAMEGHTLELDDVHTNSKTHIGTVVIPAAWAFAEYYKKSGTEFLLAVTCAYEAVSRIGMAFGVSEHRNMGWHATSTAGVFGSAIACGKLLGLDEDQLVNAMGIAGQGAGGTWAFLGDGASCKIFNPASAAVNGAKAALLAKAGMTGPEHILTAEDGGLMNVMSKYQDVTIVSAGLGTVWESMNMDNKPYPCCRSTHCTIDGALFLKNEYQIQASDIDKVEVYTYLVGNKQCGMSGGSIKPTIPVEAKFSTQFTVACALLYGRVSLNEFEQSNIDNAQVQELLSRVTVITDDYFTDKYPDHWGCKVKIICKNGRIYEKEIEDASGSVDNPLSEKQLYEKISGVLDYAGYKAEKEAILEMLFHVDTLPMIPQI